MQAAEPPTNRITPTEAASRLVADEAGLQTVEQARLHLLAVCLCSELAEAARHPGQHAPKWVE